MEFNNNKKEEHAFEFLMAEHQLAAEERWKFELPPKKWTPS